jgi:hypothetical protein
LLAIPFLQDGLAFGMAGSWAHLEVHLAVLQLDGRWLVALRDLEEVALAPDVVAFPVEILTGDSRSCSWSFNCCFRIQPILVMAKTRMGVRGKLGLVNGG